MKYICTRNHQKFGIIAANKQQLRWYFSIYAPIRFNGARVIKSCKQFPSELTVIYDAEYEYRLFTEQSAKSIMHAK